MTVLTAKHVGAPELGELCSHSLDENGGVVYVVVVEPQTTQFRHVREADRGGQLVVVCENAR